MRLQCVHALSELMARKGQVPASDVVAVAGVAVDAVTAVTAVAVDAIGSRLATRRLATRGLATRRSMEYLVPGELEGLAHQRPYGAREIVADDEPEEERDQAAVGALPAVANHQRLDQPGDEEG